MTEPTRTQHIINVSTGSIDWNTIPPCAKQSVIELIAAKSRVLRPQTASQSLSQLKKDAVSACALSAVPTCAVAASALSADTVPTDTIPTATIVEKINEILSRNSKLRCQMFTKDHFRAVCARNHENEYDFDLLRRRKIPCSTCAYSLVLYARPRECAELVFGTAFSLSNATKQHVTFSSHCINLIISVLATKKRSITSFVRDEVLNIEIAGYFDTIDYIDAFARAAYDSKFEPVYARVCDIIESNTSLRAASTTPTTSTVTKCEDIMFTSSCDGSTLLDIVEVTISD